MPKQVINPDEIHQPKSQPKTHACRNEELEVGPIGACEHRAKELECNDPSGMHIMLEDGEARAYDATKEGEFEGEEDKGGGDDVDTGNDAADVLVQTSDDDSCDAEPGDKGCCDETNETDEKANESLARRFVVRWGHVDLTELLLWKDQSAYVSLERNI